MADRFRGRESILISHAEVVLHESYGSAFFWQIRRSMRLNSTLIQRANDFRQRFLESDDGRDGTEITSDWRLMQRKAGDATGGKYAALHWRRRDFPRLRSDVPSIQCAAQQVTRSAILPCLPFPLA